MTSPTSLAYATPFELGNGNQTTTWAECIAFYERLAERFPGVLRWWRIGTSDTGLGDASASQAIIGRCQTRDPQPAWRDPHRRRCQSRAWKRNQMPRMTASMAATSALASDCKLPCAGPRSFVRKGAAM